MKYIIVDLSDGSIVRWFENEQEAREVIYGLRKVRYMREHPNSPIWEYDSLKIDNGYNLYKANLVA
jgi:hypothetical protein